MKISGYVLCDTEFNFLFICLFDSARCYNNTLKLKQQKKHNRNREKKGKDKTQLLK